MQIILSCRTISRPNIPNYVQVSFPNYNPYYPSPQNQFDQKKRVTTTPYQNVWLKMYFWTLIFIV